MAGLDRIGNGRDKAAYVAGTMSRRARMARVVAADARRPRQGLGEHAEGLRRAPAQANREQPRCDPARARSRRHRVHRRRCAGRAIAEEEAIGAPSPTLPRKRGRERTERAARSSLSPCGRGCIANATHSRSFMDGQRAALAYAEAIAERGRVRGKLAKRPLTRLAAPLLATLSHKGRGYPSSRPALCERTAVSKPKSPGLATGLSYSSMDRSERRYAAIGKPTFPSSIDTDDTF
jgi:hypothetical protein